MRVRLLHCLAGALCKHGVRFLVNLAPGGEVIFDIAVDTWEEYRRGGGADTARAELEELAQAPAPQLKEAIAQTVQEVAALQPAPVKEALTAYLAQVPAAIRRSLRRPSDPKGTTVPPNQTVREAHDLVPFLPARLPRFKAGDRPLPGVDWELEELAGVGGFGEVWKARHPYLKSKPPVALKFCLDPAATAALRNEAGVLDRVMQKGRHAGIVPLLHTYLSADPPCLEYEYVEGGDLTGLIQEMHARGPVRPAVANRLLVALAEIVAFAHKAEPPIVHGDLKPANVLVRRTAEGKVALRIIDFGIGGIAAARAVQEVRQPTRSRPQLLTEAVRGAHTPLYASPEQMARRPGTPADPRDDVHALGVIWFQLLTGELALTSVPTDWRDQLTERGVDETLIRLLGACFAPKAEKRPANAAALVQQINDANVPTLEVAVQSAVQPAGADQPHAAATGTARPEKPSGVPAVEKPVTARPKAPAATTPPAKTGRRRPAGATQRAAPTAPWAARPPRKWLLPIGAGVAVLLWGCVSLGILLKFTGFPPAFQAKSAVGTLTGKITFAGEPLHFGTLGLHPARGKPLTATIQVNGTYRVKDVPYGKYVVTIDGPPENGMVRNDGANTEEPGVPTRPKYMRVNFVFVQEGGEPRVPIPAKYTRPDTSPLAVEIAEANPVFDLDLAP